MTNYDPAVHKWYEKYRQSTPQEVHLLQVGDITWYMITDDDGWQKHESVS
jgi:hypothetical protein